MIVQMVDIFLSLSLGKIKTKVLVWKIFEKHEITILTW